MVVFPGRRGRAYDVRSPLWGQRWVWSADWLREAAARNTMPAVVLRGLFVASAQVVAWALYLSWCVAFGLWMIGVF